MIRLFLFSVMFPLGVLAQVAENFSDGDFTQNPAWTGDISHFKISSSTAVPQAMRPALQLDAPAGGVSALSVPQQFSGDLEWQFWVKMSLNTTAGNFSRFYLLSDQQDVKSALKGYFLQIGGAEDSVLFFRQDSLEVTRLLRLKNIYTGNSSNVLRFRITRSLEGDWKFYCDSLGGQSLTIQGEIHDLQYPGGNFFGFFFQYTSSNTTKFYTDDIYAGPLIVDTVPPSLTDCRAVNPFEILLTFSEPVELQSAEDTLSYILVPDIDKPYEAIRLLDPSQVYLFFEKAMETGREYTLTVSALKDPAGNEMAPVSVPVLYYELQPYDLIFTEIMADPSPPRALPEYEYVELFNRSSVNLKSEGLVLKIGGTGHELPAFEILPEDFLLVCDEDALEYMQHLAPAISIPSFSLTNGGSSLELTDSAGRSICYLEYDISWYRNDSKAEGGWSMEMIDPGNPCLSGENWTGSVSADGGTPGQVNSVNKPVQSVMKITSACCSDNHSLLVSFGETVDLHMAADTSVYLAEPYSGHPLSAIPQPPGYQSVLLMFEESFSPGQIYNLTVSEIFKNCIGEEAGAIAEIAFALSESAEPSDLVINEVLFNPLGDGVDYVELYNRSNRAIDLEQLIIASVKGVPPELPDTQSVDISTSCRIILPGAYLALTTDPEMVKSQYVTEDSQAFLQMASFPSFNNDIGYVLLTDQRGQVIDAMSYSEEMHFLMLGSYEGVSLERISPERPSGEASNWHSAAETAGFGTPGYRNSQYLPDNETDDDLLISPEIFSPDGDGKDDNLGIYYHFDAPGKLVTVLIFDSGGHLARTLVNNEMPGTEGFFSWDGTLDDRTSAQNGIYVIYLEALDMNGKTKHYKKAGVLARNR